MAITDWPASERPRERLLKMGAAALSDAELLAIFLRVGTVGKTAVDLARELLTHFGGLPQLCAADRVAFLRLPGMGDAKYAQLQAAVEIARRSVSKTLSESDALDSPESVRRFLKLKLGALPHEVFCVLLLDRCNRLIELVELFRGTIASVSVHPREVVKAVLARNAAAVILAHNHPSGNTRPSEADLQITRALSDALALIDVPVLDHFIVAPGARALSFAERGLLDAG
ncbi:MAG: DNA repair protein RadC [Rhodocyclaceae bacterium]